MVTSRILTALAVCGLSAAQIAQTPLSSTTLSEIPLLGFGTWNLDKSNASDVVSAALQTGYRHIDCAKAYGNQEVVGKGIKEGAAKAGLRRDEIWVTSKLWNDEWVFLGANGAGGWYW